MNQDDIDASQRTFCAKYNVTHTPAEMFVNSGFALLTEGKSPVNGLRHAMTDDTTGWYIWCGQDYSPETSFFQAVHTLHIYEKHPEIGHLLGLPAGYRFLCADGHLDVWFDDQLL
jgi:hypothetical protein